MDKPLIAVIDDEEDIRSLLELNLDKAGYRVRTFEDGKSFFEFLNGSVPDLLLLDLMLPDQDGVDICKELRTNPNTKFLPIIMLTAKGDESDKVIGLELGADDYVTKPFSPKELIARIKALLRRADAEPQAEALQIRVGDNLCIDLEKHVVSVDGEKCDLTHTEFKILKLLTSRPGRVYSREEILNDLWGDEKIVVDRTIDVHVKHIREKIGELGKSITNVRGVGYKFEE